MVAGHNDYHTKLLGKFLPYFMCLSYKRHQILQLYATHAYSGMQNTFLLRIEMENLMNEK